MDPVIVNVSKNYLEGPKIEIQENYGGLGCHFLQTLTENLNKIHQIDTVTGVTETNGSVRTRAIQVAHEMRHFGVVENDIILICSRCHADQTVVVLACFLIGAILAPLDSEFHFKDYVELVKQLKPKICFCDLRALKQMERACGEIGITPKMIHFGDQQQYATAFRRLLLSKHPENFKPITISHPRKRVAFILATQGTGGTPKLVCLSHHFIYSQIKLFLHIMDQPEKILSFYSLAWILQVILVCLCFEVPVVRVLTGAFLERAACKYIQDLKIDYVFLNTDLALQLAEHVAIKDFNLSYLKCIFIGSLTTTSYDIKRLTHRLPKVKLAQIYCTTETGAVIACPPQDYSEALETTGAVGKVLPNSKIRIVDIYNRHDVEPDLCGELLVASECMMLGYFKNMTLTKLCTQQGYFKTGDIARYDNGGWIYIEGCIANLFNIHGNNESPHELEDLILRHPFVKDVAVISNNIEVVACVIVKDEAKLDDDNLIKFISEKKFIQVPTRIIFMNEFPTTPLGKIRRDLLKKEVWSIRIEHSVEHIGERN